MEEPLPKIVIIAGPTASGKTALALELTKHLPIEIISADSRQIYKHLTIGTAKPSAEELKSVPHYCIDVVEPTEKFTAWNFQTEGRKFISEIVARKKIPLIVGGTGLYIQALVDGFFEQPEFTKGVRSELEKRLLTEGAEILHAELEKIDPISARKYPAKRTPLVLRALEVFYETGIPISQFHSEQIKEKRYNSLWFGLQWKREILYERINVRVEKMLADGLLDEVKNLQALGFSDSLQALQTVGYKEAFQYVRNEISYERMRELIQQNTRRFAKRQLTWFRKETRMQWFNISDDSEICKIAVEIAKRVPA